LEPKASWNGVENTSGQLRGSKIKPTNQPPARAIVGVVGLRNVEMENARRKQRRNRLIRGITRSRSLCKISGNSRGVIPYLLKKKKKKKPKGCVRRQNPYTEIKKTRTGAKEDDRTFP